MMDIALCESLFDDAVFNETVAHSFHKKIFRDYNNCFLISSKRLVHEQHFHSCVRFETIFYFYECSDSVLNNKH
ncbi:hypothetical protein [Sulfurimonas sp.]|uniref:hypothetical protein n=1 Tax=Sulfurimonas sp. TaxID=2022749 RepID=UPI003D13C427